MVITVCTAVNLGVNMLLYFIMLWMYRQYRSLGWQEVGYKVGKRRMHRSWRIVYFMQIYFRGSKYIMTVSRREYEELYGIMSDSTMVYVREFREKYLNPDLEKYEFSLHKVDWDERDKRKGRGCLYGMSLIFEILICILVFQV